jgi:hypothetical protein
MRSLPWRLGLAAACAALTMFGKVTPVFAAEEDRGGPGDRLQQLERRVNEMAQRQEHMMQRIGEAMERRGPMGAPGEGNFRPPMAGFGRPGMGQMQPPMGAPAPGAMPGPENPPACVVKCCKDISGMVGLCFLVCIVCNILLAIWISKDIRRRGEGSALFIALALLAGFPTAIVYALVRIAERKP